ncbi:MAG: type VI secretion system tube protein Hcp [Verrucomicrobiae bacterium]|nr:type VI secretion system tube protein Hcp [Verrucomicrobiae bacterium]MCP5534078.1 type VI secretion system tube protein Hcp [Akkermansiaceae bacterium]MCP5545135.1 type VI secretion system tube protein Hcp [Akkermansiaceae bacterium]MCP5546618.1 type VI secretion system tube protein Hcp [Akkermansiaceae bacterium]
MAASALLAGCAARAGTLGWLDFDGAIPGGATSGGHEGWIEIDSFEFGAARAMVWDPGAGEFTVSKPVLPGVTLGKSVDVASPLLFKSAVGGPSYPEVTLDLHADANRPLVRVLLKNVMVSSFSNSMNDGTVLLETFALNFTKITYTWFEENRDSSYADYDLATDQASSGAGTADTDMDGMPDEWESSNGLSVGTDDAGSDLDGDGLRNIDEFRLGTDPRSGTSFFKATLTPLPETPGSAELEWNSIEGKTYVVEWSPDLVTPFAALRTVTATGATCTETIATGGTTGFYRVRPQ